MKSARIAFLSLALTSLAAPAFAEDPSGKWTGVLEGPDGPAPIAAVIVRGADGKLSGTGESVSQSQSYSLDKVNSDGSTLSFDVPELKGTYKATWDVSAHSWIGKWSQEGQAARKMTLSRPE